MTSAPEPSILVVAPWLEGGGGQAALLGVLRALPTSRVHLVVLFRGNRNHETATAAAGRVTFLDQPRTAWGALRASHELRPHLADSTHVYSLMRGSHVVLGLMRASDFRSRRLAASFHQLPSEDSRSQRGKVENVLVRRAVRRATLVTAPSERAVREIVSHGFAPESVTRYEPNVVPGPELGPRPPRQGGLTEVRLAFVGRLTPQKGLDRLPELLDAVTVPVVLRIVGDGDDSLPLSTLAADIDPRHRVELIGHSETPHDHLAWADALLLPSRWELNPVVVWEAWSLGRPTIASRLGVFEDLAATGPVHLFADSNEFRSAIERVAQSSEQRNSDYARALAAFESLSTEGHHLARFLAT